MEFALKRGMCNELAMTGFEQNVGCAKLSNLALR